MLCSVHRFHSGEIKREIFLKTQVFNYLWRVNTHTHSHTNVYFLILGLVLIEPSFSITDYWFEKCMVFPSNVRYFTAQFTKWPCFFFFLSLLHQALIFNAFSLQRDLIFESWCSHLSKNVSFFCNINELVSHSHECQQHYTSHIKSTNFSLFDAEQKKFQCKHDINVLTLLLTHLLTKNRMRN